MKNYKPILLLLFAVSVLFTSCNDSELTETPAPAPEAMSILALGDNLTTTQYTESLTNANIILTYQELTNYDASEPLLAADDRLIRMYAISDGTYTNASGGYGYNLDDFDNATYSIIIFLISGTDAEINIGDYAQTRETMVGSSGSMQWAFTSGTSSIMQNKLPNPSIISIETGNQDNNPVKITGGVEDGDIMSVNFSGGIFLMVPETHPLYPSYSGHAILTVTAAVSDESTLVGARSAGSRPEALTKLLSR